MKWSAWCPGANFDRMPFLLPPVTRVGDGKYWTQLHRWYCGMWLTFLEPACRQSREAKQVNLGSMSTLIWNIDVAKVCANSDSDWLKQQAEIVIAKQPLITVMGGSCQKQSILKCSGQPSFNSGMLKPIARTFTERLLWRSWLGTWPKDDYHQWRKSRLRFDSLPV